ncbi:hypothetical protein [Bosea lathyri]|uniref:Uncharacterized protein n=1 Tax=Bosea lathyri TaxID=1036778 RepID=A0A1H6BZ35_9HYPH|nr:hypothetical protein [Bosea lathyri]SEG65960.1 hypothetical protein SAMN04488115_108226 [Bosea lathyri]
MRHTIETAPKDGKFVILEDDATGIYDVAQWSPEAAKWIGKNSEPTKLTPTHWHPLVRDEYFLGEDEISSNRSAVWASVRRHRKGLYTGAAVAAGFLVFYAIRDAAQYDSVKIIGRQVVAQATQLLSQVSKTSLPASRQSDANQTSPPSAQQVQVTSVPHPPQSQNGERAEAVAQELTEARLTEARRTIERLDFQLRAETAKGIRSLEQERKQSIALALETAAARNELAASAARYRQALDEERARSTALENELATAKSEIETQAARLRTANDEAAQLARAEAAKSLQSLEQERKQSAAHALEAATARNELAASSADYRQALEEESARSAALESQLATAQREIETQAARLRTVSDETGRLAHAEAAKNVQTLEQERKQSAVLALDAAAARSELAASSTRHRQALDEERARSAALAQELATARLEIETQMARLQAASNETGQLRQATTSAMAELEQSRQQERDRIAAMARDVAPGNAVLAHAMPEPVKSGDGPDTAQVSEVAALPQTTIAEAQSNTEATRLIARASALLIQGDIGAARIVLESAAETGSARASFMLAETYDPAILTAWGTFGTRGEVMKARELYAKAHAGGIQEAKDRFNALRQ